jgi:arylsulfatase A-like enzyme
LSTPADPPRSDKTPALEEDHHRRKANPETPVTPFRSLWSYALLGGAASLLLGLIELIDLNFRLTPEFQSLIERTIFGAYFSLDIAGGLLLGFLVGLSVHAGSALKRSIQTILARFRAAKKIHKWTAASIVCAVAAVVLNQQPQVHGYVLEIIREAEKFESLTVPLLNHERSTSYLMLMAFVVGCSVLWMLTQALRSAGIVLRGAWIVVAIVLIACAYYVDSRFEPLLYTTSIHRSMFLFDTALSMSLVATVFSRPRHASAEPARKSRRRKTAAIGIAIVLIGLVGFTFARFDKDQNLKTLLFYRTTQAKQYFKLVQWVLDFDRDGYSVLLGGGDCDDRRADINPGHREILDDGVDHNCIGGALTKTNLEDWNREHTSLHLPPDAAAKRLNVIYVFVDAMRADHLSAYGYSRKTSPNLDKLAARSSLFENAFTPAPNTFEALPKFTQGAYWDAHLEAWPEILARNGYDALLFPRRIATLGRHVKGMTIVESARGGTFKETIDAAIALLGSTPKDLPFAAYLYSTDTHRPYRPHAEANYGSSTTDLYDSEVSYVDFHLGRLFAWLEQSGRLEETVIVIMADHGESLGERGVYKHSSQLYNEQTHVPLIIHFPGVAPRSIKDYVSTIDLGPTILNAVGLDYPKECAGVSLMPLVRGQPFEHPPIYGEQTTQEVNPFVRPDQNVDPELKKYMIITQDGFKLIYNRDYYSFELYDLANDPREIRNLFDRMPDKAADLRNRLGRFIDVVTVSRPWDADEGQYVFGPTGEPREAK